MAIEACTAKTNHDRLHEEKSALLNRPTEASIKRPGGVRSWRFTRTETGWMRRALLGQKDATEVQGTGRRRDGRRTLNVRLAPMR